MSHRAISKFDFMFSNKEEKKKILGIVALYLEDLSEESYNDIYMGSSFKSKTTREKRQIAKWVWNQFRGDVSTLRNELKNMEELK